MRNKMGAILGTVPGWERDSRWTPGFRIYTGPAYIKYEVPPTRISPDKRHEYRVRIDLTVYLCDSPDLSYPLVIREIKGILIVSIFEKEYPGGLEQWISDVSIREAEELLSRSNVEVAGLVPCDKRFDINTYDEQYIPPVIPISIRVPKYILEQVEYLEGRERRAITNEEKMSIRREIDRIKSRYKIEI